jgi:YgiT-type zinc finger domain-containing protein
MMLRIKTCPTCDSRKIHLVRKDYHGNFQGKRYVAKGVRFYECPNCGEQVFGPEAMKKIEDARPKIPGSKRVA